MIVLFGSSTDVGQRLAARLTASGYSVRTVSRSGRGDAMADLRTGSGVRDALDGASIVVSCAHAEFTSAILNNLPATIRGVALTGSAWRHSRVPNPRADLVRSAEAEFVTSGVNGVMLHPAMIYGGLQERNISRLLSVIKRLPLVPAPDGGKKIVQPIFIDDLVDCLFSAVTKTWHSPTVIDVAGPQLTWRQMVEACCTAIGCPRAIVSVPVAPVTAALTLLDRVGLRWIDPNVVRRFGEEVISDLSMMTETLGVTPRPFEHGISLAVAAWRESGVID